MRKLLNLSPGYPRTCTIMRDLDLGGRVLEVEEAGIHWEGLRINTLTDSCERERLLSSVRLRIRDGGKVFLRSKMSLHYVRGGYWAVVASEGEGGIEDMGDTGRAVAGGGDGSFVSLANCMSVS